MLKDDYKIKLLLYCKEDFLDLVVSLVDLFIGCETS